MQLLRPPLCIAARKLPPTRVSHPCHGRQRPPYDGRHWGPIGPNTFLVTSIEVVQEKRHHITWARQQEVLALTIVELLCRIALQLTARLWYVRMSGEARDQGDLIVQVLLQGTLHLRHDLHKRGPLKVTC